jgi:cytochrome c556
MLNAQNRAREELNMKFFTAQTCTFIGALLSSSVLWAADDPGTAAVETRRAAYSLIGKSFKPLGAILKGEAEYNPEVVKTHVNRVVVLSGFLADAFPAESNLGEPLSKAKADIWRNQEDFKKRFAEFIKDAKDLETLVATETGASPAFKKAAGKLAQDCKGCHDNYKLK